MSSGSRVAANASVEQKELLGNGTRILDGAKLFGDVKCSDNVLIDCNTVVYGPVTLGRETYVGPNCIVGFPTQSELVRMMSRGDYEGKKAVTIGDRCVVRSGTTLYSDVKIGDEVLFGHNVVVREQVEIGSRTKIGTNAVVDGKTRIGSRVSIQTGVYVCTYSTIEDGVFLGPCCVLTNDKYVAQKPFKLTGPTIRKGASIGANALIFPGIIVGEGAVVGSQAMVNSDVPARTVFVGIPARKLRKIPKDWRSLLLKN